MARNWLERNTDNRPLRPFVVDGLMEAWSRGEWKVTHQGIAFGVSGKSLDGQHRLHFISQLPEGCKVPVMVTTGQDDETFDAIDLGVRRTMSDVYGASTGLVSVARFVAKIFNSGGNAGLTNQYVKPFMDWVEPEYSDLTTYCSGNARIWSSAPVRAAAIIQMKRGHDEDFIKLAYHSLVTADIDSMPNAARILMKQALGGKIVSARSLDLFVRSLRAFDSRETRKITTILVKDQRGTVEDVRAFIGKEMKKSSASAEPMAVKPGRNFTLKKVA